MPSNFLSDPNIKALWRFEAAPGLAVDDVAAITLTNNNGVSGDTTNFMEGAQSALFPGGAQYLSMTDAALPAGFPSKSNDTQKVFSFAFWLRLHAAGNNAMPVGKMDYNGGKRSWGYMIQTQNVQFYWGTGNGTGGSFTNLSYNLVYDRKYHVTTVIDGPNGKLAIYIFDSVTGGTTVFTYTGKGVLWVDTCPLIVGGTVNASNLNGNVDELVFFNRLLTYFDSKAIREASFPPASNNYAYEPACKALWKFEPGHLNEDSVGGNNLTAYNAAPYSVTCPIIEGAGSVGFNSYSSWNGYNIANANLGAGFPFKSGDTVRQLTACFWWGNFAYGYNGYRGGVLFEKYSGSTGFRFYIDEPGFSGSGTLKILINGVTYNTGIVIPDYRMVHISIQVDGAAPSLYVRVFKLVEGTVSEYSATPSQLAANAYALGVGGFSNSLDAGNGLMDHAVVFNRLLTTQELDDVRNGVFGAAGITPPEDSSSQTMCQSVPLTPPTAASATTCQNILASDPAMVPHSLTTCEGITYPAPAPCKSHSITQALFQALPNACVSRTKARDIILDGGDFFLTF